MTELRLTFPTIHDHNAELLRQMNYLMNIRMAMSSLRHNIDPSITARRNIRSRLNQTVSTLDDLENDLKKVHTFLEHGLARYSQTEDHIRQKAEEVETVKPKTIFDYFNEWAAKYEFEINLASSIGMFLNHTLNSETLFRIAKGLGFSLSRRNGNVYLNILDASFNRNKIQQISRLKDLLIQHMPGPKWMKPNVETLLNQGMLIYDGKNKRYTNNSQRFRNSGFDFLDKHLDEASMSGWRRAGRQMYEAAMDEIKVWDDFRGWQNASRLTMLGKGLGIAGTAFSVFDTISSNFGSDQDKSFGKQAANFGVDLAIDVGAGAAAMATGAAIGSAFAPPIGTVVGFAAGAAVNFAVNHPIPALGDKSIVDFVKDEADKYVDAAVDWVKDTWKKMFW